MNGFEVLWRLGIAGVAEIPEMLLFLTLVPEQACSRNVP